MLLERQVLLDAVNNPTSPRMDTEVVDACVSARVLPPENVKNEKGKQKKRTKMTSEQYKREDK